MQTREAAKSATVAVAEGRANSVDIPLSDEVSVSTR